MNLGDEGCSEPRSRHCTLAWATRVKLHLKKKKKKKNGVTNSRNKKDAGGVALSWGGGAKKELKGSHVEL